MLGLGMSVAEAALRAQPPFADHLLALDFRNRRYRQAPLSTGDLGTLAGYSYSRSGAKLELGSGGSLASFAANVPGIVPDIGYWSRAGLTNLLLRSQEFDNASWTKTGGTISANAVVAPDGSATADTLVNDGTAVVKRIGQQAVSLTNAPHTVSVFVKQGALRYFNLRVNDAASNANAASVMVDLQSGVISGAATAYGTFSAASATISSVGNGWLRVALAFTPPAISVNTKVESSSDGTRTADGQATSYTGTANEFIVHAWQAQLVAGSQPGPVIVTTGSTASVGADTLYLSSPITADEDFVMWATANFTAAPGSNVERLAGITNGTANERLLLERGTNGSLAGAVVLGGIFQPVTASGIAQTTAGRAVILVRRRAGKWTFGSKNSAGTMGLSTDVAAAFPASLNRLDVGQVLGNLQPNAPIEFVGVRKGTFSDAEIAALLQAA